MSFSTPDNRNCLRGLRCPNPRCESTGPFWIDGTARFKVSDDGCDEFVELDFDDADNHMRCVACECGGALRRFRQIRPWDDRRVVFVTNNGDVSYYAPTEPRIRMTDLEVFGGLGPFEEIPATKLPGLPASHRAFQVADRFTRGPVNPRMTHELQSTEPLHGTIVVAHRGLLP